MSILDTHFTDKDLSEFSQTNLRELYARTGSSDVPKVVAQSFFLNPSELGCNSDPDSLKQGIRRKLQAILPSEIYSRLPPHMADTFLGLGDLAYMGNGAFNIIFSRPNNSNSLVKRISDRSFIEACHLGVVDGKPSCGFDNLDLLQRTYEVFNSIANGGVDALKRAGNFQIVQYRSMLGARRTFLQMGGDVQTLAQHEGAAHIRAFTKGHVPYEYLGYMADLNLTEQALERAYYNVMSRLADMGYTQKTHEGASNYSFLPVSIDSLSMAVSDLLDEYANRMSAGDARIFSAFHSAMSVGNALPFQQEAVRKLDSRQIVQYTEQLIAFKTLKGLKDLMGAHVAKFVPQQATASYDKFSQALNLA